MSEVVVFGSGEVEKPVELVISDDVEEEESEIIVLYLTSGDRAILSPHSQTYITVTDDDGKLFTTLSLSLRSKPTTVEPL